MFTYDQIWETFLENYKVDDADLPQSNEDIYKDIYNAVLLFNNRMRTKCKCDDLTEVVEGLESEDDLLILCHYIKLVFLSNELNYYESLWQPFSSDVGLKNFNSQLKSLKSSVERQDKLIDNYIINAMEDFI